MSKAERVNQNSGSRAARPDQSNGHGAHNNSSLSHSPQTPVSGIASSNRSHGRVTSYSQFSQLQDQGFTNGNGHVNGHINGHSNGNGSAATYDYEYPELTQHLHNGHTVSVNGNGSNGSAINSRVLLLNQNYEPLTVTTAKRAIVMALTGIVHVVERHENKLLRSVNRSFDLPTVIRLDRYVNAPRKRALLNRKNILARDNHRCQYCNATGPNLTIDHVISRRRGGQDSWENLVTACVDCNSKKGSHTPEEVGMKLLRKPKRPDRIAFIRQSANSAHASWRPYLFMD